MKLIRSAYIFFSLIFLVSLVSCQKNSINNTTYSPALGPSPGPTGPGLNADVSVVTVYNGNLIAGGRFTAATTGATANCIAQWNGTAWSNLGSGLNGAPTSMVVYNGNLVVGGTFTNAGGNTAKNIAVWNGSNWQALGNGFDEPVNSLIVYNGNLIAGGSFDTLNGGASFLIAQWNGTNWQPIGAVNAIQGGIYSSNYTYAVNSLTIYNGNLIAGGYFFCNGAWTGGIAQWNGTNWSSLGNGLGTDVYSLAAYNGNLIAGGTFVAKIGTDTAHYVAQWNGSAWSTLGTTKLSTGYAGGPVIFTLNNYNGGLVIGGQFYSCGGSGATGLAEWNGSTLTVPFGNGIAVYPPPTYVVISSTTTYNGNLIVAGDFTQVTNTLGANYIAQWNGSNWSAL